VLTLIITLLCLYYLSFTMVSRNIQKEANSFATSTEGALDFTKKQKFLDSIWTEPVYNLLGAEFTYKDVKDTELSLGLDLQGGMHVVLEVSPVEILKGLSGDSKDPNFLKAIEMAVEEQRNSQEEFLSLFYSAYQELSPNSQLSEIFANAANRGRIDFDSSDDEVLTVLGNEITDAINRSFNILRTRIDRFGTSQPNIQRLPGTGRIQVEIPGAENPERVRKLLQGVAKLEFWEVASADEYNTVLVAINDLLVKEQQARQSLKVDDTEEGVQPEENAEDLSALLGDTEADSAAMDSLEKAEIQEQMDSLLQTQVSPLLSLVRARDQGALVYNLKDTARINSILAREDVQTLIPRSLKLFWEVKPRDKELYETDEDLIGLFIVRVGRGGKAPLTGEVITNAYQSLDPKNSSPAITLQMSATGAKIWKRLTTDASNKVPKDRIAITLDSYVQVAPSVNEPIPNGSSQISGNYELEEAKDLANMLKAGSLPAPTRIVQEEIIGPTLGKEAQQQGVISIIAGLVIVVLFMLAYYSSGGFVANFALLFNIFFILGILAQLNAALTLPGIAGMVLTIGMSIDANVLIFERIREELRGGMKLREAISRGYRKAYSSIIDSNVTTFLTAVILYVLGQGPVKGFAITLMIGIACSFFSAVFITRVVVDWMTRKKGDASKISFATPFSKGVLSNLNINFLGRRRLAYLTSGSIIVVGLVLIGINGLNLGVDFQGGRSYVVTFDEPVVASDIKTGLTPSFENSGTEVKWFGGNNVVKVTTNYLIEDESTEADDQVRNTLISGLSDLTGQEYIADDSKVDAEHFTISSSNKVGATIADDIVNASMNAGIIAIIVIFMYILIRFRKWQFSLGSIVALIHDTLFVLAAFAIGGLFGISYEIDQVFVAAILTIIGYSINDTVIVFDRIRENLGLKTSNDMIDVFNQSINSTLNRTLITSVTTLIVILVLLIFGGEVLRGFSFALLVGVLVGTYSSIFIATPVVIDLSKKSLESK